jgi:uncharacterized protein DUF3168
MGVEAALQTALFSRLNGASLGVAGVYDVAPQAADSGNGAAFPYVVMGRVIHSQYDTQTKTGHAAQIRIHTFSRSGAMLECKTIQGAIYDALHKSVLSVAGFNNFSLLREDSDCEPDQDGKIHGVCEYRALIESA